MWTSPDRLLAARIAGQFGLVTRTQALGAGVTRKTVACHLEAERWVVVHPGVYLTTPGRSDWSVRSMAALLWAGRGAVLFGGSAGYAWGLVRAEPDVVLVAVPYPRLVSGRPGVAIRRSRTSAVRVDPYAWPHRIASTHTVFDLADGRPLDRAVMLAARALDLRLCTADQLVTALASRKRQTDRRVLLEMLTDVAAGSNSAAELRDLRDVERAHGLPPSRRDERQRDGRRDRGAAVTGRLTVRAFWPDLVPTPCGLAGDVAAILSTRGWRGQPSPCRPTCSLREGSVPLWGT